MFCKCLHICRLDSNPNPLSATSFLLKSCNTKCIRIFTDHFIRSSETKLNKLKNKSSSPLTYYSLPVKPTAKGWVY